MDGLENEDEDGTCTVISRGHDISQKTLYLHLRGPAFPLCNARVATDKSFSLDITAMSCLVQALV